MIKKHWKVLLIASLSILIPVLAGVILWDQLPQQIPSHWNAAGEVDGWSSKPFFVFGMPLILLAALWLGAVAMQLDPKRGNHPDKVLHLCFWIIPVLSVVLSALTYATALGKEVPVEIIVPALMGLIFTVIGNYMPKCKHNYTIGIKIPWTLNSEENWNRTHRFAGWLWVACGLGIMATSFFGVFWLFFAIVLVMVIAPCTYSYILHRKGI